MAATHLPTPDAASGRSGLSTGPTSAGCSLFFGCGAGMAGAVTGEPTQRQGLWRDPVRR